MKKLAIITVLFLLWPRWVFAQGPTPTFNEIWHTPTPTPTATAVIVGTGTPTPVALPQPIPFPAPNYPVPTSIPLFALPTAPAPITLDTTPIPSPLAPDNLTPPATRTPLALSTVNSSIVISHSALIGIDLTITNTETYSYNNRLVSPALGILDQIITYTTWLTGEIEALQSGDVITVVEAPSEYAPTLPRPLANVGWTFESYADGIDTGQRFTISSWATFLGYMISLPFQLVKALWVIVAYLGPFGLFLAWLLIMFGLVIIINLLRFLYHLFITLFDLFIKLIDLLGQYLPTGG